MAQSKKEAKRQAEGIHLVYWNDGSGKAMVGASP